MDGAPLPADQYAWSATGQLVTHERWPRRPRCVEVDAVHGYDPVPDAVRAVTLTLAAREIANPERLRSASVGTVTRAYHMDDIDMSRLAPYRIPLRP